jgi:geranylgeranyl pyrophosphate synthase
MRLHAAIRYSVLGGGKRVRPALLFATARTLGLTEDEVEAAAYAIELIHVCSLIHDDLPSMDDDDLRRGRLTCHKAFDEATAMLAGDALQPLAIDWAVQGTLLDIEQVDEMHALKTGAIIRASVLMAVECAPGLESEYYVALARFATAIGLAFQIQDDLLDLIGDATTLGKATGADRERAKPTLPAVIGIPASQERVHRAGPRCTDAIRRACRSATLARRLAAVATILMIR